MKELPKPSEYLTKEQDDKAMKWLFDHVIHVMKLIENSDGNMFPPSKEDINHPNLWKPGSWMWFVIDRKEELASVREKGQKMNLLHVILYVIIVMMIMIGLNTLFA